MRLHVHAIGLPDLRGLQPHLMTYLWNVLWSTVLKAGGSFLDCWPCWAGMHSNRDAAKCPPWDRMMAHLPGALCSICMLVSSCCCDRRPFCAGGSNKLLQTARIEPSA